jgi:hypothetical protein
VAQAMSVAGKIVYCLGAHCRLSFPPPLSSKNGEAEPLVEGLRYVERLCDDLGLGLDEMSLHRYVQSHVLPVFRLAASVILFIDLYLHV